MKDKILKIREIVDLKCSDSMFKHHKWFFKYHIEIVLQISKELCKYYKKVNQDIIEVLVYLHDYGKILGSSHPDETTLVESKRILNELSFDQKDIEIILDYLNQIDSLDSFENAPIEVKILSSADGASHFIGPFFSIYYWENPNLSLDDILSSNLRKIDKDWNKKIVLKEVKEMIEPRYRLLNEMSGRISDNLLNSDNHVN